MTFLGADLSLTSSGIVAVTANGVLVEKARFQPKSRGPQRLLAIAAELVGRINGNGAEEVVIEAPFTPRNPKMMGSAMALQQMHGVIATELHRSGIKPPFYVQPKTLKLFATGNGNAEKSDMKLRIFQKWGYEFGNEDECDAYAAARMAGVIAGKIPAQGYELECVKTVLKSPLNSERTHAAI